MHLFFASDTIYSGRVPCTLFPDLLNKLTFILHTISCYVYNPLSPLTVIRLGFKRGTNISHRSMPGLHANLLMSFCTHKFNMQGRKETICICQRPGPTGKRQPLAVLSHHNCKLPDSKTFFPEFSISITTVSGMGEHMAENIKFGWRLKSGHL